LPGFSRLARLQYARFRLPSGFPTGRSGGDVVPFLYFPPPRRPRPAGAVLILHGYGARKELLAPAGDHLQRAGWAGLIPDLPFHGERALAAPPVVFPFGSDLGRYVACAGQMLSDTIACLAWLGRRPEVDARRLGLVGFSLGGVLVSSLMGLDLGLAAGVSLMAAGDWADVLFGTTLAAGLRLDLERGGITREQAVVAFRDFSASTYASSIRNLLIVGGRRDELVPARVIEALWVRLDQTRNRLIWTNSGHIPPIRVTTRKVLAFLREKLGEGTQAREVLARRDERLQGYHGGGPGLPLPPPP
jgi:dienelactone hydrolase